MAYNLVESKTISVETSGENIRLKATGDFGNENVVVESIRTKNIFGNYTIINGYLFETRMSIRTSASDRLAFIECKPNTTYTISRSVITTSFRVSDYTSIPPMTDTYVDYTVPTVIENNSGTTITYTTSPTAKYLVIHYGNVLNDTAANLANTLKTMQVEEGTTATTYSPYQNLNGTENYTTEEIIIGKWINGKPLYRKVFTDTMPQVQTDGTFVVKTIDISSLNTDVVFFDNPFFMGYPGGSRSIQQLPTLNQNNMSQGALISVWNTNIEIRSNRTIWNTFTYYVPLCYTKTTD